MNKEILEIEKRGYSCPCCGFLTLSDDSHETFEICPVCNWEDDDVQFNNPDFRGGANEESLNEARKNYKKFGASSEKHIKKVRGPLIDEIPMKRNLFDLLQDWYLEQCDGDWEHEFGIKIDTLDNPGWNVNIDLTGTKYEDCSFKEIDHQIDDNNWIQCSVKNKKFIGSGGPKNLTDIIRIFLFWKNSCK